MDDDWEKDATAPPFTLMKYVDPEEQAEKDGFVDFLIYNRWSKTERRLYHQIKTAKIARKVEEQKLTSMNDLVDALGTLNLIREKSDEMMPMVDDLINQVKRMQIQQSSNSHET